MHLSFLTSYNLLLFSFYKTYKKTAFSVFLSFFSRKIVHISIFKVEYLENGFADFNDFGLILQDFERPFRCKQLVLALQFSFKESIFSESENPLRFHVTSLTIIVQKEYYVKVLSDTQHGVVEKQMLLVCLIYFLPFFDLFLPLSSGERCDESRFLGRRSLPSSSFLTTKTTTPHLFCLYLAANPSCCYSFFSHKALNTTVHLFH